MAPEASIAAARSHATRWDGEDHPGIDALTARPAHAPAHIATAHAIGPPAPVGAPCDSPLWLAIRTQRSSAHAKGNTRPFLAWCLPGSKHDFDTFDFVVTTYSTIEATTEAHNATQDSASIAINSFTREVKIHLRYYQDPMLSDREAWQKSKKWADTKVKGREKQVLTRGKRY
ncbi:hypothetical protein ZWY2020_036892 [Hordeum vulgare]|nr:hypothetical protein ZWY2020_036892 [Hordeum vulgare]